MCTRDVEELRRLFETLCESLVEEHGERVKETCFYQFLALLKNCTVEELTSRFNEMLNQ